MRKTFLIINLLLINIPAFSNPDQLLNELESVLAKKARYTGEKLRRIEKLKLMGNEKTGAAERYSNYVKIFEEYKTLNFDSALTYAGKIEAQALLLKDPVKINRSKINRAFILLSSGMFRETQQVVDLLDPSSLAREEKFEYYNLKARYYYDLCDFVKNGSYCAEYTAIGNRLADSALAYCELGSYSYFFVSGLRNLRSGNSEKALKDYSEIVDDPNLTHHQYAIIASTLSYLYGQKNEKDEAFALLVKAAIADIKSSTKENTAMFRLADTLFRSGSNERAYKYIRAAMEDAEYYGARHRQFEVGTLLPIIEGKQLMLVENQKNMIFTYAAVVTLLILVIVAFIFIVVKQNRKLQIAQESLSEANLSLHQTNATLTEVNGALREANRIKDEYIGYYFNINSDYIDKIERFKKSVSQRLSAGRFDDIKQIVDKIDLRKEREELSGSFDTVFIKLFPNFVSEFNSLFEEKDRVKLCDGQLLNTELRIFALIRLGIHDNDKIAKILNFSVNTIYNYKTRIKNKSFVPNDEFENRIMEIKAD